MSKLTKPTKPTNMLPSWYNMIKPVDLPKLLKKWWRIQRSPRSPLDPSENCPGLQLDGSVTSLDTAAVWTLSYVLCFSCVTWLCSEVFYGFSGERLATTNLMNKTTGLGLSEDLIVSVVELCTTVLFLIIYIYMLVSMLHAQGNLHGHSKASSQYKNRMGIS